MAATTKLTDADIKRIRRRVRAGQRQADLAEEFGVDRKTIRRRLDALERAEIERAERIAEARLRRQASRERRLLRERERDSGLQPDIEDSQSSARRGIPRREPSPYFEFLDRRKNLSGRARVEASGLIRIRRSDGTLRVWVERSEVDGLLDDGWLLDE